MSIDYAAGLSHYDDLGDCGLDEVCIVHLKKHVISCRVFYFNNHLITNINTLNLFYSL